MSLISPKNILIVKNRAMGDSVMGLATVSYIKELFPDANIYYAIPAWIVPLYKNVKTDVDAFVPLELKSLKGWWSLRKQLFPKSIDLIYEMHLSGRTEKFFGLYSKIYKIPYHFHNHHLKSGGPVRDQGVYKALIQRDLDGAFSHLSKTAELPSYLKYLPKMDLKVPLKDRVILGVVATRETKKWPLAYFASLCHELIKLRASVEIIIPLSLNETDSLMESELKKEGLPENVKFIKNSLEDLPVELAAAHFYLGNDTGLKHICVALGVKTFTFFGPEPPMEWHPYDEKKHPYFYKDDLECRTVKAHYCALSICDSMLCLKEIYVKNVLEKVAPLLK